MPPPASPDTDHWRLRVLLVDDDEVSRAACRALLRTEGVDVVEDLAIDDQAVAAARALSPEVVIVDVTPGCDDAHRTARRLRSLPDAPMVLLTSSADRSRLYQRLDEFPFVAKADIRPAPLAPRHAPTGPPSALLQGAHKGLPAGSTALELASTRHEANWDALLG